MVDQLRGDLLQRYDPYFTGGFRRLIDGGAYYPDAHHDHAATETAVGHATVATGLHPARHGIAGNEWREYRGGAWVKVYCVEDPATTIVGGLPNEEGRSPANLRAPTIAEWLQAAHPDARVVALAGKDRSAILLAGRARGDVYWFDDDAGRFVTSSHYAGRLADFVTRFERERQPAYARAPYTEWRNEAPAEARALARRDDAPYEGVNGTRTAFPHLYTEQAWDGENVWEWLSYTPAVDAMILALARDAIDARGLGRDDVPDLLALGLSQTDYVGHRWGPHSQEQLDNLLKLDRALGAFFDALDHTVGAGRWSLALTSDHGVLTVPEFLRERGEPGLRVPIPEHDAMLAAAEAAARRAGRGVAAQRAAAEAAESYPFVADAVTFAELESAGAPADSFVALYRRAYVPGRPAGLLGAFGIELRPTEGTYLLYENAPLTAGHGSPYWYDRWVPVIFYGPGIAAHRGRENVRTVDVAPTLARLGGIRAPAGIDGRDVLR